jgi:hypothetical protein
MTKSSQLNLVLESLLRFLFITPFTVIFIAVPGLVTLAAIVLIWSLTLILFAATFATPIVAFQTDLVSLSFWSALAIFSTSFFAFFASFFMGVIIFFVSKYFAFYMFDYVRWNYKFIFTPSKAN